MMSGPSDAVNSVAFPAEMGKAIQLTTTAVSTAADAAKCDFRPVANNAQATSIGAEASNAVVQSTIRAPPRGHSDAAAIFSQEESISEYHRSGEPS